MLHNGSSIEGRSLMARDGKAGTITDLLFDDRDWRVRWAVVRPGNFMSKRKVLVPAGALDSCRSESTDVSVRLSKSQVIDSDDVDIHRPVSRQLELELMHAYGWDPYWGDGTYLGAYRHGSQPGHDALPTLTTEQQSIVDATPDRDDPNLRSMMRVIGSVLRAIDGDIGVIADFVVDDTDWTIAALLSVIAAGSPAHPVHIEPSDVRSIDWTGGYVNLRIDQAAARALPPDGRLALDRRFEL